MPTDNTSELDKYINDTAELSDDIDVDNNGDSNGDANNAPNDSGAQDSGLNQDHQAPQDDKNGGEGQQPNQGDKATAQDELRPIGDGNYVNARGDVVSGDGKVIAQSGFASRLYNTNRRLKSQVEELSTEINTMRTTQGEYKVLSDTITRAGISNDELATAIDYAARMKRGDHVGVAKDIVAFVVAQGYNVTDLLGGDVGDSVEMKALKQMLDQRLAPITREEQDRTRQAEVERVARANYTAFVNENEYADVHGNEIARLSQAEGISLQAAYNRIYRYAATNGLDISQPLGPQVQERARQMIAERGNQSGNQRNQKPMPNGGATRSGGAIPSTPLASADDDWGSIIKSIQETVGKTH